MSCTLKTKLYLIYSTLATLALILGTVIIASQLVGQKELPSVSSPGSYIGYISLVWHGRDRLHNGDTTLTIFAVDAFCLILPYLITGVGLWSGILGYRRRKFDRITVQRLSMKTDDSQSTTQFEDTWPPPIRTD